jgi:hypothetical protein
MFFSFKSIAVSFFAAHALFAAPAQAQLDDVTDLVCGAAGAANFLATSELLAAVKCITSLSDCNSTSLPEAARTDLTNLDALNLIQALLDKGILDQVLNGGIVDIPLLTGLLEGGLLEELLGEGLLDGLLGDILDGDLLGGLLGGVLDGVLENLLDNVEDVVDKVLELVDELLSNLLGFYGDNITRWCTGLLSSFDGIFAGLDVSEGVGCQIAPNSSFLPVFSRRTSIFLWIGISRLPPPSSECSRTLRSLTRTFLD